MKGYQLAAFFFQCFNVNIFLYTFLMCSHLPKRRHFYWRLLLFLPYLFFFLGQNFLDVLHIYDITQILRFYNEEGMMTFSFSYIVEFFLDTLLLWFCFRESFLKILFVSTAGYCMQHLTNHIKIIILMYYPSSVDRVYRDLIFLVIDIVALLFVFFYLSKKTGNITALQKYSALPLFYTVFVVITINIISQFMYSAVPTQDDSWGIHVIYILLCIALLIIDFGFFDFQKATISNETMSQIMKEREKQQALSEQTISSINRKVHDLKHQIRALETMDDKEKNKELDKTSELLSIYDSRIRTGNSTIDTIFSEKSLICHDNNITISVVADGKLLSFIDKVDLYTFFGNALDNAIEYLKKVPEDKRNISVSVSKVKNMVFTRISNYCQDEISFRNGLPKTTKTENKEDHGIGTSSMKMLVEKYKGQISFEKNEDSFDVNAIIPLPEKE